MPATANAIPRIIHQTWKDHRLPDHFRRSVDSWQAYHPQWLHRLWTDPDIAAFVKTTYPRLWPFFQSYPETIQRVDAARYLILHHFGGIYSDLDILCIHSMDGLRGHGAVLAPTTPVGFSNDLMMARPGHPLFGELIAKLARSRALWQRPFVPRHFRVLLTTGSLFLTMVAKASCHMDDVHILAPERYRCQDPQRAWVLHTTGNTWAGRDTLALALVFGHWKQLVAALGGMLLLTGLWLR